MERRQLMMNGSIHAFFEGEGVRVDTNVDGELDLIVITAAIIGQFKALMEEMIKIRRSPEDEEIEFREDREPIFS